MHLLIIAFYLSILTFYLGTLIYALPIPIASLKKWGPRLINDAFFITILTLCIEIIIGFANYLRQVLGGDWNSYLNLAKGLIMFRSGMIIITSSITGVLSKIIPGILRIVSTGLNILTTSLYSLILLYFLGILVYYGIGTLTSLGITLMAIPFRIARNAGAFILSFALVFYLALPLYPYFAALIASPLPTPTHSFTIIYGNVHNSLGRRVANGYVGVKVNGDYLGPVKLEAGGRMAILVPRKYMTKPATIYLEASGHRFYTNISDAILENLCLKQFIEYICEIDIEVKGLLYYGNGLAIHTHPLPEEMTNISIAHNTISFTLYSNKDIDLYLSVVEAYRIVKISIDNNALEDLDKHVKYSWTWYGVPGKTYVMPIARGYHEVSIVFEIESLENLEPKTDDIYTANLFQLVDVSVSEVLDVIAYTAYLEIVSSILYLSLLLSITYGLSRLLGAKAYLRLVP